MPSLPNKFYDDSQRFALQAKDLGLIEPAVSLYFNGVFVGGTNYDAVEVFDLAPNNGYPSTFVDLVANTFLRDTYQKADGSSGNYGTSFAGTFSYRPADGGQALVYIPSVDHADLTVTDSVRYADTVSAHFGSQAQLSSTRTFPDPTLAYTTVGVANGLSVQQDIVLATGSVAEQGDVFRAGTLSSMFASATNFDASLILWEDPAGNVHSLALGDGTPRDTHLFAQPQALGSWIELVKEAGSQWYPDSPTVRLTINNPHGLHLGLQGFLAASTNPNDDSLSVWLEILDHPTTLAAGGIWQVDFELIAMAPLVDNTTYVTPFSAKLTGTPFVNVTLSGTANRNAVGADSDNVLLGNAGNNALSGGSGNDTLDGAAGNDTFDGGPGEDTVTWQYGVSGSTGVTASLATGLASGFGNDSLIGIEHLIGSPNADSLTGDGNANALEGKAGNDNLKAAGGDDTLLGGDGVDVLDGGSGADTLNGGDGNDYYFVDNVGDFVFETTAGAAGGNDVVYSALSTYTLTANVEIGRILATDAANLTGNALANVLFASIGNNVIDGSSGADTVTWQYGVSGSTGVTASLMTGLASGSGNDTLLGIENLAGSANADSLTGDGNANALDGAAGNDNLNGAAGNDTLRGGDGVDVLDGGSGADSMNGGDGNDYYFIDNAGDLVVETNASAVGGNDVVYSTLAVYALTANVETGRILPSGAASLSGNALGNLLFAGLGDNVLDGGSAADTVNWQYGVSGGVGVTASLTSGLASGSGNDTLIGIENLTGSANADSLTGDGNANALDGAAGNDNLNGAAGNDTLLGGDGVDVLDGGSGADSLNGGAGNDYYFVDNAGDLVVESGAGAAGGNDVVYSTLVAYTLTTNVETGRLLNSGVANLTGNALANFLFAGLGDNMLDGGSSADTVSWQYGVSGGTGVTANLATGLASGSGNDTLLGIEHLSGSANADSLTGDGNANALDGAGGNDTLDGGLGNDWLIGGLGKDNFVFATLPNASSNVDRIIDFTVDDDTIVLENAVFTSLLASGPLAAGAFRAGAGATSAADADDFLIYDTSTGALYYDAVGNSGDGSLQIALLGSGLALTAADFLVT